MKEIILIVDDEKDLLEGLKRTLDIELKCEVLTAENGIIALDIIKNRAIDIVLTDISMPKMDGVTLLKKIVKIDKSITTIMMTAFGTIELAVKTLQEGAYDFIQKPFDEDKLLRLLKKAIERSRLLKENRFLHEKIKGKNPFNKFIGCSTSIKNAFKTIEMLGKTDVTVLITGETGTGKDLAAQTIHEISGRNQKPLVTVNCPALPNGLLESELFGHKKGAFTNADKDKKGLFDVADGSTICLDEIGDLSSNLQTKLLRVLQNREIKPIGAEKSHLVNVRIIAATNLDLEDQVEKKEFRADLYYRLNVASLKMPSLKEMKEDIPLLIEHFLKKASVELDIEKKKISKDLLGYILGKGWPGNVRELENTIIGWCAISKKEVIDIELLNVDVDKSEIKGSNINIPYKDMKQKIIDNFTKEYLTELLRSTNGNVSKSAKISGIQRQSLQKIIKRYGIEADQFRD